MYKQPEREMIETIRVRCDLRHVLTLGSRESLTIHAATKMGLIPVLERLARRAHELNDPELEEVLDILCM